MKILKFELRVIGLQIIDMPYLYKILSAQYQNGHICVWALVDEMKPHHNHAFAVYGTGQEINTASTGEFIGTVQQGSLVWHVFDKGATAAR